MGGGEGGGQQWNVGTRKGGKVVGGKDGGCSGCHYGCSQRTGKHTAS